MIKLTPGRIQIPLLGCSSCCLSPVCHRSIVWHLMKLSGSGSKWFEWWSRRSFKGSYIRWTPMRLCPYFYSMARWQKCSWVIFHWSFVCNTMDDGVILCSVLFLAAVRNMAHTPCKTRYQVYRADRSHLCVSGALLHKKLQGHFCSTRCPLSGILCVWRPPAPEIVKPPLLYALG